MAALRIDPELKHRTFLCRDAAATAARAPSSRAGTAPIKDDIGDRAHGTLDMERAIAVSCNAYFAQLGVHDVGSKALAETAAQLGISTGDPAELRKALPFAAYGQGPVLISPFKMARVAAAIAAGGRMPQGRWVADDSNPRTDAPLEVLPAGAGRIPGRRDAARGARRARRGTRWRARRSASRARPAPRSWTRACRTPGSRASRRTTATLAAAGVRGVGGARRIRRAGGGADRAGSDGGGAAIGDVPANAGER